MQRNGQLWLYRTKPKDDELFSSLVVRQAYGLAMRLQTFSVQFLNTHPGFWEHDVDRVPNRRVLERLSSGTAVSLERLQQTGLAGYTGRLWCDFHTRGPLPWIMPIGKSGRYRTGHGQQFCRRCLAEDAEPYFRRRWRLAFAVACAHHGIYLDDACRVCGAPVAFHTGDFGVRLLDLICPITKCGICGADFRDSAGREDSVPPDDLIRFQAELIAMLELGWSAAVPGGGCYAFLAFDGIRYIVRALCSRGRCGRLRALMQVRGGELGLDVCLARPRPVFEELRVGDRAVLLKWCLELLRDWPNRFVEACRTARVSSSYLMRYGLNIPYWFDGDVAWYLGDNDYIPSERERLSVLAWLDKAGLPVTQNSVRKWLGISHTKPRGTTESKSDRWNFRGPKSLHRFHLS